VRVAAAVLLATAAAVPVAASAATPRSPIADAQAQVEQLLDASATALHELKDLAARSAVAVDGLICPVDGPIAFTDDWGQPRPENRQHRATAATRSGSRATTATATTTPTSTTSGAARAGSRRAT